MKSAVILAGGRSERMGFDKCAALFHDKPLVYWPYTVLRNIVDEVIISVSAEKETYPFLESLGGEVVVVKDEKTHLGPISGLHSSFKKARGEYAAVAPCDTPFIKTELYLRLFEMVKGYDGAVPVVKGYWEPLLGVYKREAMLKTIEKVLEEGKNRPTNTFEYLNIIKLSEEEIKEFDPELLSFININSREELEKALIVFNRSRQNQKR